MNAISEQDEVVIIFTFEVKVKANPKNNQTAIQRANRMARVVLPLLAEFAAVQLPKSLPSIEGNVRLGEATIKARTV